MVVDGACAALVKRRYAEELMCQYETRIAAMYRECGFVVRNAVLCYDA